MRILALNPPFLPRFSRGQRSPAVTRSGTLYYPIWLSYAVGALEQAGHEVLYLDAPAECIDLEEVLRRVEAFSPEMAVVETSTPSIRNDVDAADELEGRGIPTFLVGTHPSALPEETLAMGARFSGLVVGEYEMPLVGAAAALQEGSELESVPGLHLRRPGGSVSTGPGRRVKDLDSLAFVSGVYARHLPIRSYNNPNALHPQVMILGGRGCPNYCSFCVFPQTLTGRTVRMRSISNIVAEMRWIEENMPGVKAVFFEDDTLSADTDRLRALAGAIAEAGVSISWTANMRANVDYETLAACRKAGLRSVCTGFESGVPGLLGRMRKGVDIDTMRRFTADARRAGVLVHGCFLFGIEGETAETMEQTLRFALELDPDTAQFYPLMVYPGTEAYREAEAAGHLSQACWRDWLGPEGLHNCVIRTDSLSGAEIAEFCDRARQKFYLRPGYIARKAFRSLADRDERRRTMMAFKSFRHHLLPRRKRG